MSPRVITCRRQKGGSMRTSLYVVVIAAVVMIGRADAKNPNPNDTVKIGILTDMSGIYSDIGGPGSVIAAKLAIEDFQLAAKGMKVELLSADMQNKPDVGVNIANAWFDVGKVDVIVDGMNSGVSLAVSEVTRQKNKLFLVTGAASSDLRVQNAVRILFIGFTIPGRSPTPPAKPW